MESESLITLLSQGQDSENLLNLISNVQSSLPSLPADSLNALLNSSADWICKNSSSKKLESLLSLCISIHIYQGHNETFTYPLTDEISLPSSTNLVSCILSLLNSILKSPQAEKYIKLLSKLLILSCFIAELKSVPDLYRRKGTLKFILTLFKSLVKAGAKSEQSLKVLKLISDFFSKICTSSPKCREYLIRKGSVQLFCNILGANGVYSKETELVYKVLYALGSVTGTPDQQLLVWVSGGVSLALSFFESTETQEPACFVLWKCSIDSPEVQETLMSADFALKALKLLQTNKNPYTITYLIGILRRLALNPAYKQDLGHQVSQCFLDQLKELVKGSDILPLKELVAGLGSLCINPEIAHEVVKAAGIEILIEIVIRHIEQAKLVKTSVGALVNLSVQGNPYIEGIVDRIASNIKFYELLSILLSTYSTSSFMMEYVLKLILNSLQNNNCLFHLSEGNFMTAILGLLRFNQNEEDLFTLTICIMRTLVSHSIV